jgi:CPA1 family monovalent cation:H+ antiporter
VRGAGGVGTPAGVHEIEFLMLLLLAIALLAQLAGRLQIPYPVFLVVGGLAIALIPGIPRIQLEPDVVFLVFLPPLLYAAALTSSPRDLRAQSGRIALLAIALVVLTVVVVAAVARLLIGDLSWPMAFVLGAVLAPTDPVAATSVFRRTHVPERVAVIVEGEALVNDGVGLSLYRAAVGAATAGTFSLGSAALKTVLIAAGGVVIGLAIGWVLRQVRRRIQEAEIEITLSLFTPYAAYIAAEAAHASGVLAAVTVGLYSVWHMNDMLLPETRLKVRAFWAAIAFLLESVLFVLVGLQLPVVLDALAPHPLDRYLLPALGVAAAVMVVRMSFVLVFSAVRSRLPRVSDALPAGERLVVGWSGMRGAVSLAAALAVPVTTQGGTELAGRDIVLLVTFVTILVTIVLQGLTLPLLIRATGLHRAAEEDESEQRARLEAAQAAMERLDRAATDDEAPDTTVERLRTTYAEHAERAAAELDDNTVETEDSSDAYRELRAMTLAAERDAVTRLREEGKLSHEAARRLQHEIDLAESKLNS